MYMIRNLKVKSYKLNNIIQAGNDMRFVTKLFEEYFVYI